MTYSLDANNTNITVLVAGTKYPIFGSQFHPEKPQFEWNQQQDIPHSYEAILGGQMYADFIVDHARKNTNSLSSQGIDFDSVSIYNFNPVKLANASFDQIYFFKRAQPQLVYETEFLSDSSVIVMSDIDTPVILENFDYQTI